MHHSGRVPTAAPSAALRRGSLWRGRFLEFWLLLINQLCARHVCSLRNKNKSPSTDRLYTVRGRAGQLPLPRGARWLPMKVPGSAGRSPHSNNAWFVLCLSHCCHHHMGRGTKNRTQSRTESTRPSGAQPRDPCSSPGDPSKQGHQLCSWRGGSGGRYL